jgi:hypothetical protein
MRTVWHRAGARFFIGESTNQLEELPIGIYKISSYDTANQGEQVEIERTDDNFKKIHDKYDVCPGFVNTVIKTWAKTNDNLGLLLTGTKGTGKTQIAKQICNLVQLPILVITKRVETLPQLINSIQQDIVILFDEYEKMYDDYDHSILTVMDGILSNGHRRMFILTTNKRYVNENMLSRPGRIRYLYEFDDLELPLIKTIIDTELVDKQFEQDLIDNIKNLSIITVDIVKSICEEINIHNKPFSSFINYFNVKETKAKFDVNWIKPKKDGSTEKIVIGIACQVAPVIFDETVIGQSLVVENTHQGKILSVVGNIVTVGNTEWSKMFEVINVDPTHRAFVM